MRASMLKNKACNAVQRDIAADALQRFSVAAANTGLGSQLTLAEVMRTEKQAYKSQSAEQYLKKQHQAAALKKLPYWMDGVDADVATAKQHINRLYRWLMAMAFILGAAMCVLLFMVWQMLEML